MSETDRVAQHLQLNISCLRALGFWPAKTTNNRALKIVHAIFSKFILIVFTLQTCLELIEMYFVINKSLNEFSFLLGIILFHFIGMVKVKVIMRPDVHVLVNQVLETEQEILSEFKNDVNEEIVAIYKKHVRHNRVVTFLTLGVAVVCCMLFCLTPILTELVDPPNSLYEIAGNGSTIVYKPRPLPLMSWFPFDRYKYYKTSYAWHVLNMMLVPFLVISCDNLFFGLMTFSVGQLKILQHNLYNNSKTRQSLRRCIEHHKKIISFVKQLEKAMKNFLMVDFGVCGLQVAVIGLQIALEDMSFQVLNAVMFLVGMLVQLFLFYWIGNEILIESERVATTIWDSKWYQCDPVIKKMYLMIILRSQKPLSLSVGPFYKVSTATMMLIFKTSYSYGALMHRLYSDK